MDEQHPKYMALALKEAKKAGQMDEVPIGAVLVSDSGDLLSVSRNMTIASADPTAHAEILALQEGSRNLSNYRLLDTVLYVTVEPCIMCMGAILHARVSKLVFGAPDPNWGAAGSVYNFANDKRFNHQPEVISGVYRDQCAALMQEFFRSKR
jgi:tRNA(adenine34) deaminase